MEYRETVQGRNMWFCVGSRDCHFCTSFEEDLKRRVVKEEEKEEEMKEKRSILASILFA